MKWAGGKRYLLPELIAVFNKFDYKDHTFYDVFVGGGSVFLELQHKKVVINDINSDLMNIYEQVRDHPEALIESLKQHEEKHGYDHYYAVRNIDRTKEYESLSDVEKASRILYLNHTCYNGLYRVNKKGQFNVPIGKYKDPEIVYEERIIEINRYLNDNNVVLLNKSFSEAVKNAKKGDLLYFDPPYDYDGDGFTSYTEDSFTREDLVKLKETADMLIKRGCHVVLSNNDTSYVNELFKDYCIIHTSAPRFINSKGNNRQNVGEVIIYG